MKKFFLLLTISFVSLSLFCQENKPAKLRITYGFFSEKYELGDLGIKQKDVLNHLELHDAKAYASFKSGISADTWANVFLIGGAVALVGSLATKEPLPWITTGLVLDLGALILTFSAKAKKESAIEAYNRKFGYQSY